MKRILCVFCLLQVFSAFPCSIFMYQASGVPYFCGNEDWSARDPALLTIKPTPSSYGVVLFGWDSYLPSYPQAGINSEGLCFDWATVPSQHYTPLEGKAELGINSTIDILKTCRSVDEVIAFVSKYNFPHVAEEHIMFADRAGNSCVIEYTGGEQKIVRSSGGAQYMTNFNLTDKEAGWYPCSRYSSLESALAGPGLSEPDLVAALDAVHQEGQYPTIYSYVMNLRDLSIKVFYNHRFTRGTTYTVKELTAREQKIRIK